jgi:hypothetical protein
MICDVEKAGCLDLPACDYDPMKDFICRMDTFIDIMNGKKKHGMINGPQHEDVHTLLDTLDWFAEWKEASQSDSEFITNECYEDMQVNSSLYP